jgi:hypothetical protein
MEKIEKISNWKLWHSQHGIFDAPQKFAHGIIGCIRLLSG